MFFPQTPAAAKRLIMPFLGQAAYLTITCGLLSQLDCRLADGALVRNPQLTCWTQPQHLAGGSGGAGGREGGGGRVWGWAGGGGEGLGAGGWGVGGCKDVWKGVGGFGAREVERWRGREVDLSPARLDAPSRAAALCPALPCRPCLRPCLCPSGAVAALAALGLYVPRATLTPFEVRWMADHKP